MAESTTDESAAMSVAVALALAATEYAVLSRALPRAGETAVEDPEAAWSSDPWE